MIVNTTYDPSLDASGHQLELIKLWEKCWSKHGWEPAVHDTRKATRHRWHDAIAGSKWLLNTVNDWGFTLACYRKWMVMAMVGGFYADADVMNYGFIPPDHSGPITYCGVSCMNAPAHWYENVVRSFRNAALLNYAGPNCLRDDLSEMNLFKDLWSEHVEAYHYETLEIRAVEGVELPEDIATQVAAQKLLHFTHGVDDRVPLIMKIRPPI